jgi:hypothetical protein
VPIDIVVFWGMIPRDLLGVKNIGEDSAPSLAMRGFYSPEDGIYTLMQNICEVD